jgi:hypothetical protein
VNVLVESVVAIAVGIAVNIVLDVAAVIVGYDKINRTIATLNETETTI